MKKRQLEQTLLYCLEILSVISMRRVVNLERGVSYFYVAEGLNPNDENSALIHYIQGNWLKDVKLKILYCGICHTDLHQVKNEWEFSKYPMVPGAPQVYYDGDTIKNLEAELARASKLKCLCLWPKGCSTWLPHEVLPEELSYALCI